jgi:hypothetical protein
MQASLLKTAKEETSMAKSDREGFTTVETDLDELDEKIQAHRRRIFKTVIGIITFFVIVVIGVELWMAVRSYESYEVMNSFERTDSDAAHYLAFCGNILKYSNDGVVYTDSDNELIWNQAFEIATPRLVMCEEYLAVYDKGGSSIYIMKEDGPETQLEMTMPIETVCIAKQGTIAVLMKDGTTSYVKMYDRKGNELANGEFYADKGGIPIDIALSFDAQKLAVDMLSVMDGNIKSTITFYNFGSVGQNEINNNVGVYSYADTLIPEIEYLSDERMIAVADNEIILFSGSQKPQADSQIFLSGDLESIVYDEKYIAVVTKNTGNEVSHHIAIYDMKAKLMMENDTSLEYTQIEFLDNHELCLTNELSCEIYTGHGILRFQYTFDTPIRKIISHGVGAGYIFILDEITEEVRLK